MNEENSGPPTLWASESWNGCPVKTHCDFRWDNRLAIPGCVCERSRAFFSMWSTIVNYLWALPAFLLVWRTHFLQFHWPAAALIYCCSTVLTCALTFHNFATDECINKWSKQHLLTACRFGVDFIQTFSGGLVYEIRFFLDLLERHEQILVFFPMVYWCLRLDTKTIKSSRFAISFEESADRALLSPFCDNSNLHI